MTSKMKLPTQISLALLFGAASAPGIALADLVCHVPGNNAIQILDVNAKAIEAHIRHGDYLPYLLYRDADGDGFGDADTLIPNCLVPPGRYVDNGDDFDDNDYYVHKDPWDDDEDEDEGEEEGEVEGP